MVYKLKPLELSFQFEDREYNLGDTVDIQVNLKPAGDVSVREARVDLVCEEVYSRNQRGVVIPAGGSGLIQGGGTRSRAPTTSRLAPGSTSGRSPTCTAASYCSRTERSARASQLPTARGYRFSRSRRPTWTKPWISSATLKPLGASSGHSWRRSTSYEAVTRRGNER